MESLKRPYGIHIAKNINLPASNRWPTEELAQETKSDADLP